MKHPRSLPRWLRLFRLVTFKSLKRLEGYEKDKVRHPEMYQDRQITS